MEKVVILHNIRSSQNVGSIFRTADAAGFKKIYLCGITPAPLDRYELPDAKIAKVALGAEKSVFWEKKRNTSQVIADLQQQGFEVFAVEQAKGSVHFHKVKPSRFGKIALLMGEEVKGVPAELVKKCDSILEIPMFGEKESLNVSVAFGIVAYHFALAQPSLIPRWRPRYWFLK